MRIVSRTSETTLNVLIFALKSSQKEMKQRKEQKTYLKK